MYRPDSVFFNQQVQRIAKPRVYWEIVIPAIIVIVVAGNIIVALSTDFRYTWMPSAILIIPLTFIRKQQTVYAQIYFRHTHGQEFNFGYVDGQNKTHEFPVKEYTYWTCLSHRKGFLDFYLQLDCGSEVFHMKEERIGNSSPVGWTLNEQRPKTQTGFFIVSNIERLAHTIDRGSGNELTEENILNSMR